MTTSISRRLLLAGVLACTVSVAQLGGTYSGTASLPIPTLGSGSSGGCVSGAANQTEFTISVPDAFVVTGLICQVTLTHTAVGDLTLKLSHCGTSVTLYDRSPPSTADLNGTYAFSDSALTTFASAIAASGAVVPPAPYMPVNPLTPFHGMSSAGAWTISICDQLSGNIGTLTGLSVVLYGWQGFGGLISPPIAIPDGSFSAPGAPVTRAVNVTAAGLVDTLIVTIGMTHTWVRDLDINLSHDGVEVTLSGAGSIKAQVGVSGDYDFMNPPGFISFDAAAIPVPPGSNIPPGQYLPDEPLAAFTGHLASGVWLLTVCDTLGGDVGQLSDVSIMLSTSLYTLSLQQPSGPSYLAFNNYGGAPGHHFVNLVTLVPGNFPNGWVNGLDIPLGEILNQVSMGAPFFGTLGNCGSTTQIVWGPIPSGLPVQLTSFELDQNGLVVTSFPAFQYITN